VNCDILRDKKGDVKRMYKGVGSHYLSKKIWPHKWMRN